VIGLFDMELFAKGKVGARSVHVFTARGTPEPEVAADEDDDTQVEARRREAENDNLAVTSVRASRRGMWLFVVLLACIVSALATAVIMRRGDEKAADCPPTEATPASRADTRSR
jgi:hypothetical protein